MDTVSASANGKPVRIDFVRLRDHLISVISHELEAGARSPGFTPRPMTEYVQQAYQRTNVRLPESLREQLFPHFTEAAGEANTCESDDPKQPSIWEYSADDVVISASYQDRAGRKLVGLRVDPARNQCDGPRDDAWATHWFLVADSIHLLGVNLSLVDAGDYDADGAAEILFWYSGYNKDGYSLFYDGLKKRVDYLWNYH